MSQRIAYRGPRPKGRPPVYENQPVDRDEAIDFMIDLAARLGNDVRIEGPIPAGKGYDARMPVEHLGRYYAKAWDNGFDAAVGALADLPDSTFADGRDAVICSLLDRFQNLEPAA